MQDLTVNHVGLTVSDLDRAVAFYRDTLGLELLSRFSIGGEAFATAVGIAGASADFAHLDADGARVELVAYDPEGAERPDGELNQPGTAHLGLDVADLDHFYADLPEDVATVSEPRTTESGTRICFLRDPDGHLIELVEV